MSLRPIKTEADYQTALKEIEILFDAPLNTPECDKLEILTTLVEAYESQYYHIDPPDPITAINYYLESRGLSSQYLQDFLGNQEVVKKVLERKQALTLDMIRQIKANLEISADILIQTYPLNLKNK